MDDHPETDDGELGAIIATLRQMIDKLDAMGIRTEGSYISMAADLLDARVRKGTAQAGSPDI